MPQHSSNRHTKRFKVVFLCKFATRCGSTCDQSAQMPNARHNFLFDWCSPSTATQMCEASFLKNPRKAASESYTDVVSELSNEVMSETVVGISTEWTAERLAMA